MIFNRRNPTKLDQKREDPEVALVQLLRSLSLQTSKSGALMSARITKKKRAASMFIPVATQRNDQKCDRGE